MKKKLKELRLWLPTIILAITAVVIIINLFFPFNDNGNKYEKNMQESVEIEKKETTPDTKSHTQSLKEEQKGTEKAADTEENVPQGTYLLNTNSKKFHLADCKSGNRTKESNRRYLSNRADIVEMGYEPCKLCNP